MFPAIGWTASDSLDAPVKRAAVDFGACFLATALPLGHHSVRSWLVAPSRIEVIYTQPSRNDMTMLLLTNALVVTMNPSRDIHANGAVLVDGSRIVEVGDAALLALRHSEVKTMDLGGKVLMPGLIDVHNHPFNYLVGGHGDDLPIKDLLYKVFYPFEQYISEEETYIGAKATFFEMIRSGVTCFNDAGGYMAEPVARAAADMGIRGIINRSARDLAPAGNSNLIVESTDEALGHAVDLVEKWNGACDGRLRAWFGIRVSNSASDDLIRQTGELARQYGVGVHSHVAAGWFEKPASLELFGKRPLDRYRDLGLLGPNVCAVHMGFLDDDEIPLVVESQLKIAHCPVAAMIGAWGIIAEGRIPELMNKGVTVGIGSDTAFGSGTLDMFRQMFVCATAHRETHKNPKLIGAAKALDMCTIDAAKVMLWDDEIGSLEAGKKADLIILKNDALEWHYPGRDILRSIVYSGSRGDVEHVMVDGQFVMKNGVVSCVDQHELRREVDKAGAAWLQRSEAQTFTGM